MPIAICIRIAGCSSGDEQVDKENPSYPDQSREARASQMGGSEIEYFLLMLPLLLLQDGE